MYWTTYVTVSPDFSTGNSSATDITGLTYSAAANGLYEIEALLIGQSSDTNGGTFCAACSASGSTGEFICFGNSTTTSSFTATNVIGSLITATEWKTATTDLTAILRATIKTGANSGNITIQIAKSVSGTVTVRTGSVMKVRKLL